MAVKRIAPSANSPKSNRKDFFNPPRLLLISFVLILLPASLVLMIPGVTTSPLSFTDALFTATSALTVTGLTTVDTARHFTIWGELFILLMIQIGGLGKVTLSMLILLAFGRRIGLTQRNLLQEELNQNQTTQITKLIKAILLFAFAFELVGAAIMAIEFVPQHGWKNGLYYSIFHSVSAFNNAGFALFDNSLADFQHTPLIPLTIAALFIVGGIGYTVILDVFTHKEKRPLQLHTKITLSTTAFLLLFGTMGILIIESDRAGTLAHMDLSTQLLNAFFQAASARTAGFNTVPITSLHHGSLLLMMVLMFIGAGSTSTGGGIKVSTFAVALIATRSFLVGEDKFHAFKRNISSWTVLRAFTVIVVSCFTLTLAMLFLMITEEADFAIVMFETISAFSTVGFSTGLTPNLTEFGKITVCVIMFIGRLGPLTLAYLLTTPIRTAVQYPTDDVFTG
ncbi:Ktr system potassium uptake protein B [BD1-7 clade bacterium]|uniref:Ktr system potassium uptake protein B n=1 Tax=BD1-7 clade bacterium TaxID=2029982 RepID=A0A5S9PNV3_9GAMM|nr:Ktr system potassium uptake protein B [BD1-7 clade bacterium]